MEAQNLIAPAAAGVRARGRGCQGQDHRRSAWLGTVASTLQNKSTAAAVVDDESTVWLLVMKDPTRYSASIPTYLLGTLLFAVCLGGLAGIKF